LGLLGKILDPFVIPNLVTQQRLWFLIW